MTVLDLSGLAVWIAALAVMTWGLSVLVALLQLLWITFFGEE